MLLLLFSYRKATLTLDLPWTYMAITVVRYSVLPCFLERLLVKRWRIQLFRERLSENVHATNPKGIVGGFELTVFQRNLKEWQERPSAEAVDICLWVLKESNKTRFDSYSVRNSVLTISHITFRDCRVHMFSDNLSRNSCISKTCQQLIDEGTKWFFC